MTIPFENSDTDDYNAANPCCCDESDCQYAEIEIALRDSELCKGGFQPYTQIPGDPVTYPDAFDLQTFGKLIPLYRTRTVTNQITRVGTYSETWNYESGGVISQTFQYNSSVNFDFTTTLVSEYQRAYDYWDAGSQPYGLCPPESTVFAGTASASGVRIAAAVEGEDTRQVTLLSPDVSPSVSGEKVGFYEWMVDGSIIGTGTNEKVIQLNKDDETCHEFTVRHVCGGNGKWSKPKVFSLNSNPCCKEPEPMTCGTVTTGNSQWSLSQQQVSDGGGTWSSSYSNTTGGPSSSDSGTFSACTGTTPNNVPGAIKGGIFGSLFFAAEPLSWITSSNTTSTTTNRTINEDTLTRIWIPDTDITTPDNGSTGWWPSRQKESGEAKGIDKTTLSNDQNQGKSTIDRMFTELLGTVKAYPKTFRWSSGGNVARAVGGYPETQGGSGNLGQIYIRIREIRHRWKVPDTFDGLAYKTTWRVGRFHDRWLDWRTEYYDWAVEKYAFLQKPKPGDDLYPKRSDYETAEEYQAAVDALDEIKDPGEAPKEPEGLKPEILDSPAPWEWKATQGEQSESIDRCDPTKYGRELHEPAKPKRDDYATDDQFKAALEDYEDDLTDYREAVEERKADSKRQSPWSIIIPDKWSDWRTKPDEVPPLPEDPTADDIADRKHAVEVYDFLMKRWKEEHHAALYVCDVRHVCNIGDPNGEIENWDRRFPMTELPPLDPTKEDPSRWADWYQ